MNCPPKRISLILTGNALRTLCTVVSLNASSVDCSFQSALPVRKPASALAGEVMLKAALALAPGAIGSISVFEAATADFHPVGRETLNLTPCSDAAVMFLNVTVTSCEEPGVNILIGDR